MRMILVEQFTGIGAPHIWNGDEVGMWGADDPDERKPLIWSDLRYEAETTHPFGRARRRDPVAVDTARLNLYHELIALRKDHIRLLVDGSLEWLRTDDTAGVLIYQRSLGDQRAVVGFNVSERPREITLPVDGAYRLVFPASGATTGPAPVTSVLPPRSARVWIRQ